MAISKEKKHEQVAQLRELFDNSKITVAAKYTGLSVQGIQELRKIARQENVVIKVVKNRLVRVSLSESKSYKQADTSLLSDQLLYAFSSEDEVAPAQILAKFAKTNDAIKLVAGYSDGQALDTAAIMTLASLPSKDQLRGQLVSLMAAPLTGVLAVMNGAQRGMTQVLAQRAEAM